MAITEVPLDSLGPNPWDPRGERTPEAVRDMAESIRQVGLLQNLVARPDGHDGHLQLAFGMTRLLALKQLASDGKGADTVPVVVRQLSDAEMAVIALTENDRRTDLTTLERFRAYQKAMDTIPELGLSKLATSLGMDHSTLSNGMRLLKLPPVVLERVESGEMSAHAAREFLCLVADDHMHTDVMRWVVLEVANTRLGNAPDWRAHNLRRLIRNRVSGSTVEHWRRVGTLGNGEHGFDSGSSHRTDPLLDVEAFTRELPTKVHTLPWDSWEWEAGGQRQTKEGSLAMTCDVKEWGRRQDAAKRGASGESGPARAPAPPPLQERMRQQALANDPVAKRVVVETVSTETSATATKRAKAPQKVDAATFTPEQQERLGSRAKAVELSRHRGFAQNLDPKHYDKPPEYFPDLLECTQQCTDGAGYGYHSYDSKPHLFCFNEKHYKQKLAAGRAKAEAAFKDNLEAEGKATTQVVDSIRPELGEGRLARMVAMALAANGELSWEQYMGLERYEPYALARVRELLGLKKGHAYSPLGDRDKLLHAIAAAKGPAQSEIAALLLIHALKAFGDAQMPPPAGLPVGPDL